MEGISWREINWKLVRSNALRPGLIQWTKGIGGSGRAGYPSKYPFASVYGANLPLKLFPLTLLYGELLDGVLGKSYRERFTFDFLPNADIPGGFPAIGARILRSR